MKKLMLASILSFVGLTAMAQDESVATQTTETATVVVVQDFQEINVADLPEAVVAAVTKDYPTATIDKAYKNESDQFKLELSLKDGASGTVYADAEGNWIEL